MNAKVKWTRYAGGLVTKCGRAKVWQGGDGVWYAETTCYPGKVKSGYYSEVKEWARQVLVSN